jgi:hypothetical protein
MTAVQDHSAEGLTLDDTVTTDEYTIGAICILDRTGDTRHMWDSRNKDEVDAAKTMFESLQAKGYAIFAAVGKDGAQGEIMRKFDKKVERFIAVKQLVGG